MKNEMLERILEKYDDVEITRADGLDEAVIGIADDFSEPRLVYSVSKCLEILAKDIGAEDATEHFTQNISGAYIGEKTPIWCWDTFI